MARFDHYEPCPKCTDAGRDRRGDNLAIYSDGGSHCFSCGWHRSGNVSPHDRNVELIDVHENKRVLPADFSREVPARAWRWLLQYGLSWKYWKPFVGWSEKDMRLVFTVGEPTSFSMGRWFGAPTIEGQREPRKWFVYGNSHAGAHVFGTDGPCVCLVEDLISAHKVGGMTECIPLFGTKIFPSVLPVLRYLRKPVLMWLDKDQEQHAPRRAAQLAMLTGLPVRYVSTTQDPKCLSLSAIGATVKANV